MQLTRRQVLLAAGATAVVSTYPARAQMFPSKPLRWVVGYSAGSGLDFVARVVSEGMAKNLGQEVIVENKPGAAGAISVNTLMSAPADGYTLLSADVGIYALNPHLYSKLQYDSPRDFQAVGVMVDIPMVLFVPTSLGINTLEEFVKYVGDRPPGSVNFASSGMGNPTHLTMELFMRSAKLDMVHVPYKGSPAAFTDLMAGETSAFFVGPNDGMQHVDAGKLKVLATATPKRLPTLPELPTLHELGYEVAFQVWLSVVVRSGTPQDRVERLNAAMTAALADPKIAERLQNGGFQIREATDAGTADAFVRQEYKRWGDFLPPLEITLD